jgi:tetratricopeptide (TPR) repeat protein
MATGSRQKAAPPRKSGRVSGEAAARVGSPTAEPDAAQQAALFERAIELWHARDYGPAHRLFQAAAGGPVREMAHSARVHAQMCAGRLGANEPALRTADEHYDYGVALINARRLEQAERHLLEAAARCPKGDHIYYALALCCGLAGDLCGACGHLKHAIELQPRNRVHARNDPDFAEIGRLPPLAELLHGAPQ